MSKVLSFTLKPEIALDDDKLKDFLVSHLKTDKFYFRKLKQSIDARKKDIKVYVDIEINTSDSFSTPDFPEYVYKKQDFKKTVLIVGAGPAGMFAALRCLELGLKPVILERGKDVKSRRRDLAAINKEHTVNPDSNYCFGEGGAGTYSDGKLYTRSKKRGDIRRVLEIFVKHGATERILIDAHPHIGTNKLPVVIQNIRETILEAGGEIHFNTKVTDLFVEDNVIKGVMDQVGEFWRADAVVLATGHSARDIFYLLHQKGIAIENKDFALGVRIEHSQKFVDSCQYHTKDRGVLPAAAYTLVAQTSYKDSNKGVFSFCMCPGGFIVPAATAQKEIVVNGMSPSRRDSVYANSGVVVAVNEKDWEAFNDHGPLAALEFQKSIEEHAYKMVAATEGEITQKAPAQMIEDFQKGKISQKLKETSYQPGLIPLDFNQILPDSIVGALKEGLQIFAKKMRGYNDGQMIGIESRTSSPVRIPRNHDTLEHPQIKGLYPCGEGAGYAGGIVSAAVDGERCINAFFEHHTN